jgi:predicted nucleotidyltransferase
MLAAQDIVTERLKDFTGVERIILFGSRAPGDVAPRADIDLAIACRIRLRTPMVRTALPKLYAQLP